MRIMVVVAIAVALAGCQSARFGGGLSGTWQTTDGVLSSTFGAGTFTSRVVSTGETVVTDGRYTRTGGTISLVWTSIIDNTRKNAECQLLTSTQLACTPATGSAFTMNRVA